MGSAVENSKIMMKLHVFKNKEEMGRSAAAAGAAAYRQHTEATNGYGAITVATGASQFETLDHLTRENLPWPRITGYHLDEYVGIDIEHRASFRNYLWTRFVSKLPLPLRQFHYIGSESDPSLPAAMRHFDRESLEVGPEDECQYLGEGLDSHEVSVSFIGIGENAHLGFNDPPADFENRKPFIVVELDEACRKQQVGEGWFDSFGEVPLQAITMTASQILKSKTIICTVPDERKAAALRDSLEGEIDPGTPASILQSHPDCHFFVDEAAASLLSEKFKTSVA